MKKTIKLIFYFLAKYLGFFALARYLTAKKVRILCYHGGSIGDEWKYNGKLFITKKTFETRINWLRKNSYQLMSLDDALAHANGSRPNTNLVTTVTFDDGWFSTYSELLSVLTKQGIPSTLYLSTKYFLAERPITSVTVRYIVWKAAQKTFNITGLDTSVDGIHDLSDTSAREQLVIQAANWISQIEASNTDTTVALNRLAVSLGISQSQLDLVSRRFSYVTTKELLECAKQGCAIELHGHVHAYPAGDPQRFKEDLEQCRDVILGLRLAEPKHYCYPSGNYDNAAGDVMSNLGIVSATTCHAGLLNLKSKNARYYLPRFLDGENVHTLEFEAEMSGFAEILRRLARR